MSTVSIGESASATLFGDEELDRFFRTSLRPAQQKQIITGAYRKVVKPIIKDARSNLRSRTKKKHTGNLLRSVGSKIGRGRYWTLTIGARTYGNYKGYHGHLVNSGTDVRYRRTKQGTVVNLGKTVGNHWWDDATINQEGKIQANYHQAVIESLEQFVNRNLRRMQ